MLIEFYGKNYGCFRDEFRLSMLATDIDPKSDRGIVEVKVEGDPEPLRLLRAAAIYGPNASGKSTVLRAAGALSRLLSVTQSYSSDRPLTVYEPFAFGSKAAGTPVTLGARAVIDHAVYDYLVSFDRTAIHHEKLSRLSDAEPVLLLDRVDQKVAGEWTTDPQFELVTRAFRENALLLSLADSLAPNLAKSIAVGYKRLLMQYPSHGRLPIRLHVRDIAEKVHKNSSYKSWLLKHLRDADIGVVDLQSKKLQEKTFVETDVDPKTGEPQDVEEIEDTYYDIKLVHGGETDSAPLSFGSESLGTRRLVELSPIFFDLMFGKNRIAVFIDEIDSSMHPVLLCGVVRQFNCEVPAADVRGQLIFATHETSLLDGEAKDAPLRRDQVYFTEKGPDGASRLYSIAEFKERNNLNMRRRYLQGRYGALPALGSFSE